MAVFRPVRIVIADNDPEVLDLLGTDLTAEGHDIVGLAPDGDDAIAMCDRLAPDVLILDFRMPPGPDGVEVARRVHERRPGVRVIMYTNYRDAQLRRNAQKAGAVFVPKGNLRALRRAVAAAMR